MSKTDKLTPPLNFKRWIDEHRHLLKPPVGNQVVWEDHDFIVMVIGGPNARKDYHVDESEEFFYQLEGDMTLKVVDEGEHRDIPIRAGEIFLLPARVPHSPRRPAGTVGLVVERKRAAGELDGFVWYCEKCGAKLHDEYLHVSDIVKQLPPVFERFYDDIARSTCKNCGTRAER
jgi:3-hydroxyanthranilate 3,4-dioxygenase